MSPGFFYCFYWTIIYHPYILEFLSWSDTASYLRTYLNNSNSLLPNITTTTTKTTVVLKDPTQWESWLGVVKTMAMQASVWPFIGLDINAAQIEKLQEPPRPKQSVIIARRTTLSGDPFTTTELADFQDLLNEHKDKLATYKAQLATIEKLMTHIIETITPVCQQIVLNEYDSVHSMLVALIQRIAPTDRARNISLIDSWKLALKTTRSKIGSYGCPTLKRSMASIRKLPCQRSKDIGRYGTS